MTRTSDHAGGALRAPTIVEMGSYKERQRLAACEAVIERGLGTFVEVGEALLTIREARLYRETHKTFEEYCRERWGFNDSRARQLIGAAETVTTVTVQGLPAPRNEAVARELAPLRQEPEKLREKWSETVEKHGAEPTAKQVRVVVQGAPQEDMRKMKERLARERRERDETPVRDGEFVIADTPRPLSASIHYDQVGSALNTASHQLNEALRWARRPGLSDEESRRLRVIVADVRRVADEVHEVLAASKSNSTPGDDERPAG